jgi:single-stranded-DNA-specific exonuclease
MARRGIREQRAVLDYLAATPGDLHSPFLFRDMGKIITRLELARRRREKLLIHGDYDVDGVVSTAMLYHVLREAGLEAVAHIPTRSEGYGLRDDTVRKCRERNISLIITVDCGITSVAESRLARELGIDLIITDHHEPGAELPAAAGILNPRVDAGYPYGYLAGVGVAFKLTQAIYARWTPATERRPENVWLELVALGTIADITPLTGENRVLVKLGLERMARAENTGLRALLAECNLSGKRPSAGQIAFLAAPRINAAGRMNTARPALELFITNDEDEAAAGARELSRENAARQELERRILEEVCAELELAEPPPVIVRSSPDWPHGVIGIVASKITELYRRPVYLIAEEGERAKGSARGGLSGYSVVDELNACAAELEVWGGHKAAGGFSMATERIPALRAALNEREGEWRAGIGVEDITVDAVLAPQEIKPELAAMLEIMAPFGAGNPTPVFCTQNLVVLRVSTFGADAHLRLDLGGEGVRLTAKAFRRGAEAAAFHMGDTIDILYNLEINSYQGREELQLQLRDYRIVSSVHPAPENEPRRPEPTIVTPPAETTAAEAAETAETTAADTAADAETVTTAEAAETESRLTREKLADFYRRLRAAQAKSGDGFFRWETGDDFAWREKEMLKIFFELGLVEWSGGANPYLLKVPPQTEKLNLEQSLRFCYWSGL